AHAHTRLLMEAEARMSREAWTRAIDACDLIHGDVISLRTTAQVAILQGLARDSTHPEPPEEAGGST
nr:hypothetical protein [Tanacetum cinerariifolium]